MYLALLMIVTGLSVSAVAAYYSIAGLIAIFAASPISIGVMGTVLEVAKLVAASWVYRNWNNAPKLLKWYFVTAVSVLIMITSLGIFGFLSKAHVDQTISIGGNNSLRIESIERRIENERRKIGDATTGIEQIDQQVQRLIDYDRIRGPSGAIETRKSSSAERESLNDIITQSYTAIESLEDEVMPLRKERLNLEAEVGPLKYIAAFVYGETDPEILERAVTWVIIIIIFVFDPLAVLLLIAGNYSLMINSPPKPRQAAPEVVYEDYEGLDEEEPIIEELEIENPEMNTTTLDPIPMNGAELNKLMDQQGKGGKKRRIRGRGR